jgi:hypothetical protein
MHWRQDLWSKLTDGMLAAVSMYLLLLMVMLLVRPIQFVMGKPGLFIFTVILIAISVYFLERSLVSRLPDWGKAWYGLIAGLLAWIAISLSNDLGTQSITSITGILVLLLFSLTITRLWKRYLPVGGRFYGLSIMIAWTGQLIISSRTFLTGFYPRLAVAYHLLGYIAVISGLVITWWIFTQTERRLQRLYLAPGLAFCIVMAAYLLFR